MLAVLCALHQAERGQAGAGVRSAAGGQAAPLLGHDGDDKDQVENQTILWQPEVAVNYSCLFFLSFYNLFINKNYLKK